MNASSDFEKNTPGKIVVPLRATLDVSVKFDLWKDYQNWLDPSLHRDFWYELLVLEMSSVSLKIRLGDEIIYDQVLKKFGSIELHHEFDDEVPGPVDLEISFSNMNSLPVRDDTGSFVSSMFEIQTLKLNDIEIKHLLDDTMFGMDATITLCLHKPIYSWMIENVRSILPKTFDGFLDTIPGK